MERSRLNDKFESPKGRNIPSSYAKNMIANRLLRWSRKLHKWIGLYVGILAAIWIVEIITIPFLFNHGLPVFDGSPPPIQHKVSPPISLQHALKIFMKQQPKGINSTAELDELTYLPQKGLYRFAIKKKCLEWYLEAKTGKILQCGFNARRFVTEKGMLGWVHPVVARVVKAPFSFLFFFLTVSGCWIVFAPRGKKKK